MRIFGKAHDTLDDVSAASQQVVETSEYAAIALMTVAAVSLVALLYACMALGEVRAGATVA